MDLLDDTLSDVAHQEGSKAASANVPKSDLPTKGSVRLKAISFGVGI